MADPRKNGSRLSSNPPLSTEQRLEQDEGAYDLWVELSPGNNSAAVAAVNSLLGCGLPAAKHLVESGAPILRDESAREVHRTAAVFQERGVGVRIDPPLPFPI
jgi:hypothetical protein